MRKTVLLSMFEVPENEKHNFRTNSPTTVAMKNSIKNTDLQNIAESGRKKILNKSESLNFSVVKNSDQTRQNKVSGHKPCARDGHSATILGEKLIIFGGDRHKMCFNDLYSLDLSYISQFF